MALKSGRAQVAARVHIHTYKGEVEVPHQAGLQFATPPGVRMLMVGRLPMAEAATAQNVRAVKICLRNMGVYSSVG